MINEIPSVTESANFLLIHWGLAQKRERRQKTQKEKLRSCFNDIMEDASIWSGELDWWIEKKILSRMSPKLVYLICWYNAIYL